MATLKGQNFRICIYDATAEKYKVIGMATGCTVTLTNNTDDASHKDVVGAAAMPTVTSKSWQVSCDSLNVADAAAMLTAIKSMQPMTLMWDETSTTDNQTRAKATFARKGQAYMNDVTFNFNDRENSTKSLQFQGSGPLQSVSASEATEVIAIGSYTKGQFVRLFLSSDNSAAPAAVVAAAKSLSLHVSMTLEDASTKDTSGEWTIQEPTALSYDISTGALVHSGESITSAVGAKGFADLENIYETGTPVKWKIANVGGDNNRTASSTICSGSVVLQTLTVNGPNRANADYTAQLVGYGDYQVSA
jgi:predicted secreted protein